MAIINSKEIQKELNMGLRHIKTAIKMAQENLVVGEVTYANAKPARKPRAKKPVETAGVETPA